MIREELQLNHEEIFDSIPILGVNIIWNQSELKLIIDDTMKSFFEEYDTKNETLDQFINFVGEEDKQNVLSFFSQDLKRHYINREQMRYNTRWKVLGGTLLSLFLSGSQLKVMNSITLLELVIALRT